MPFTPHDDPSTIMFEGMPDIEILATNDRDTDLLKGALAVFAKQDPRLPITWEAGLSHTTTKFPTKTVMQEYTNAAYHADGTPCSEGWPRLVRRTALNPDKPIVANSQLLNDQPFDIVGRTDTHFVLHQRGASTVLLVKHDENKPDAALHLSVGSKITFSNLNVETYDARVTEVDGKITNIERLDASVAA